jgi:hypothetical protein
MTTIKKNKKITYMAKIKEKLIKYFKDKEVENMMNILKNMQMYSDHIKPNN